MMRFLATEQARSVHDAACKVAELDGGIKSKPNRRNHPHSHQIRESLWDGTATRKDLG